MLVALLGLGGLAAVVFGIVYAIVNKRPGVAVASVLVPLATARSGGFLFVGLLDLRPGAVQSVADRLDARRSRWPADAADAAHAGDVSACPLSGIAMFASWAEMADCAM